jgi:hypothetical protein
MLSTPPALIAVVGPVEPALLAAWVHHYRGLGIDRFLIAFHFPEHVSDVRRHELQAACRELGIIPTGTSTGPWHEHTNTQLRDALRQTAGPGWHLLADADEFQQYPAPLSEVIAAAEGYGHRVVGGLMLDRVAASGHLPTWQPETGLDLTYPLGGHLTHRLLHGDPARSSWLATTWPSPPATTGPRATARTPTACARCTTSSGDPASWTTCAAASATSPPAPGRSTPPPSGTKPAGRWPTCVSTAA